MTLFVTPGKQKRQVPGQSFSRLMARRASSKQPRFQTGGNNSISVKLAYKLHEAFTTTKTACVSSWI